MISLLKNCFSHFVYRLLNLCEINWKKEKMAEKPKRPLSAYMLWLNDNRESIKRENPGIKVTEVAKRGGELWRALKDKSVSTCFLFAYSEEWREKKREYRIMTIEIPPFLNCTIKMTPLYKSTHFYCYTFLTAFFSLLNSTILFFISNRNGRQKPLKPKTNTPN